MADRAIPQFPMAPLDVFVPYEGRAAEEEGKERGNQLHFDLKSHWLVKSGDVMD